MCRTIEGTKRNFMMKTNRFISILLLLLLLPEPEEPSRAPDKVHSQNGSLKKEIET